MRILDIGFVVVLAILFVGYLAVRSDDTARCEQCGEPLDSVGFYFRETGEARYRRYCSILCAHIDGAGEGVIEYEENEDVTDSRL